MSKPVILYILHSYFNTAGTEEHVRLLCGELSDEFDCFIAAPFRDKVVLLSGGTVTAEFPITPIPWPVAPQLSEPHSNALNLIVNRVSPSVIHVHHQMNWHLTMLEEVLAFKRPVVMTFHDYFSITPHFTLQGIADPRVTLGPNYSKIYFGSDITSYLSARREIFNRSIGAVTERLTPSRSCAAIHQQIFSQRFETIEHGIVPYAPSSQLPSLTPVFGYIGGLLPQKGYGLLLEAFSAFQKEQPAAKLLIFGDGDGAQKPPILGVEYKGHYRQEDLPKILDSFDIGIIPSVYPETFCLTLSELWMGGKAVLASNIGALAERVTNSLNGRLFKAGDKDSLLENMRWFFSDASWRNWKMQKVRTSQEMAADYKALYKRLGAQ